MKLFLYCIMIDLLVLHIEIFNYLYLVKDCKNTTTKCFHLKKKMFFTKKT